MADVNAGFNLNQKIASGAAITQVEMSLTLEKYLPQIENSLPVHLKKNAERYARQLLSIYSSTPKLRECSAPSVLGALMTGSALGLDFSPALGECYIIPYKNKGQMMAQFQLGYRGMLSLVYRSGFVKSVYCQTVYEGDKFMYEYGTSASIRHIPCRTENRGNMISVYAIAELANGTKVFEVMQRWELIDHAKKYSKGYFAYGTTNVNKDGLWYKEFDAMCKKTVIKKLLKYLPLSPELVRAFNFDETDRVLSQSMREESDILDVPSVYDSNEAEAQNQARERAYEQTQNTGPNTSPNMNALPESASPDTARKAS